MWLDEYTFLHPDPVFVHSDMKGIVCPIQIELMGMYFISMYKALIRS